MFTRILTLVLLAFSFFTNAQLQDKRLHQFPTAGGATASVFDEISAINILENGKIYFTYYDQNTSLLTINRFDVLNNQWNEVQSITLTGTNVSYMNTYSVGNNLYLGWVESISGSLFSIARLDQNDQLQILVNNAGTNMDAFQNSSIHFSVDEAANVAYTVVKGSNSDVYADTYNLTTGAYENGAYVGFLSGGQPKIALDLQAAMIYVIGTDFAQKLVLYSSAFGATLNFTAVGGGSGFVFSPLYQGEGIAFEYDLVEKTENSPEVVFLHENSTLSEIVNIRKGLGANTNSEMAIAPQTI